MKFWFYAVRASWRCICGRWYVWRDAPTDVVRKAAMMWRWARHDFDPTMVELFRQARQEYNLRKGKT